jgi:hypothetical protein
MPISKRICFHMGVQLAGFTGRRRTAYIYPRQGGGPFFRHIRYPVNELRRFCQSSLEMSPFFVLYLFLLLVT